MLESKMNWQLNNIENQTQLSVSVSPVIKRMLAKRGIDNDEQAQQFLYPNINDLHNPFLFEDMEKTVQRIQQAIDTGEHIVIYGDYDADGVTSTSVLVSTLQSLGAVVDYYIPSRFSEGYGPNEEAFRMLGESGCTLIITVDNGIAAPHEATVAKELGIDLIITDHHEPQDTMPDAFAIIHPNLSGQYPFDDLAGVGVAFKLAHALIGEVPTWLTSYVAIGTVADLVPLRGENRLLVKQGLSILSKECQPGIEALKQLGKLEGNLTAENIGFVIAPRLNAVGRLQDADLAVDLLLEEDSVLAEDMAKEIDQLNQERQQLVKTIAEEAFEQIESYYRDDSVIVVSGEGWNPGVLGIVASRIVNKYYRPTLVLGEDPESGIAKGSGRSIPAFDLFQEGMLIRDHFKQFGGHAQAAGMTVDLNQVSQLREAFNERAQKVMSPEDYIPTLSIEDDVDWAEIDLNFPKELELLSPFGMENEKPIFQVSNITLSQIKRIGANQNHIKMMGMKDQVSIEMIGFQLGDIAEKLTPGVEIDVAGEIEVNEWNGHRKLQIKLKDVRCQEWQLFDYRGKVLPDTVKHQLTNDQETLFVYFNHKMKPSVDSAVYYEQLINDSHDEYKRIVCLDLPQNLQAFEDILKHSYIDAVYLCFHQDQSHFLSVIPTRDDFKQLYGLLKKHKQITSEQKVQLAQAKSWSNDKLDFMLDVFFDLDFVKITNGLIVFQESVSFRPLEQSTTYQRKLDAVKVDEILYYSTYRELKEWIDSKIHSREMEGEVVHEF
ncbi:single-stranded-DNA-specific exonuclease RecJ [Alkalibacillus salilacus]|uniref:Single-stranded-DNA-specific exonuclease RecJ n=1 Tax=Alkalibacillus salilacus TaxID=284582 RepID=A0ABT9VCQ7_9BACI|nr:single-stranded-DNA-specific exonuclease RecJ [Alkalibacillus salilacus]MDQ0158729.1 single-stranded-DNA-specific exonuclease [Alkalibacillus salilacus]